MVASLIDLESGGTDEVLLEDGTSLLTLEDHSVGQSGVGTAEFGGTFTAQGIDRAVGAVRTSPTKDPALVVPVGTNGASTPDRAAFAVTDADIEIRVALDDWTPASPVILAGQSGVIFDSGLTLNLLTDGRLQLQWQAAASQSTTDPLGFAAGSAHTLRATLDVDNGSSQHVVTVYTDGTQLEQFTLSGTTSISNSGRALYVSHVVLPLLGGWVEYMIWRDSIGGTAIANPDFRLQTPGATSFDDAAGNTWTLQGKAEIRGSSFGGTFTAAGVPETFGVAAASLGGTFTAAGVPETFGVAAASFGGTFAASGNSRKVGQAAASFSGTFIGVGSKSVKGLAVVSFGGTFVALGEIPIGGLDGEVRFRSASTPGDVSSAYEAAVSGVLDDQDAGSGTVRPRQAVAIAGSVS